MAKTFKQAQYAEHSDQYTTAGQFSVIDASVPSLKPSQALVRVVCAATNPVDTVIKRGIVKDMWPQAGRLPFTPGYDFSGIIEQVGSKVEGFSVGDEVCGVQWGDGSKGGRLHAGPEDDDPVGGSLAEMIVVPSTSLVKKPAKVSWQEAAAAPMVCLTAYQAIFEYNNFKSGDKVIIFGGTSAVGQTAVQLAKNKGCKVFATCSTGKIGFVKSLGATPIDYTTQNWWEVETGFDAGFIASIGDKDSEHLKDAGAFKDGAICTSVLTPAYAVEEGTPKLVKFIFNQDAKALSNMVADIEAGSLRIPVNKVFDGVTPENVGAMFAEQAGGKSLGKNVMLCNSLGKPSYTIYYHGACKGFTGRAYSPMLLLEHAGASYEITTPDKIPGGSNTFAPPMITTPDGTTFAQTHGMCHMLGKSFGLCPGDAGGEAKALQANLDFADCFVDIFNKKGKDRIMKWVSHFEAMLGDQQYFGGSAPNYVDFVGLGIFAVFPLKQAKGSEDFAGVEMTVKIKAWYDRMQDVPCVKKVNGVAPVLPDQFL